MLAAEPILPLIAVDHAGRKLAVERMLRVNVPHDHSVELEL